MPTVKFIIITAIALAAAGCAHVESEKEKQSATISTPLALDAPKIIKTCPPQPKPQNKCDGSLPLTANGFTLIGDILADEGVWQNGAIVVNNKGLIESIGCISATPTAPLINCQGQIVSPGMINAHDHLKYNQNSPGGLNNPKYAYCNNPSNAYTDQECAAYRYNRRNEWRKGLNEKKEIVTPINDKEATVVWNELRHILAGTTTVAGSGGTRGLVRNPDVLGLLEGLKVENNKVVSYNTFPLGDSQEVGGNIDTCLYPNVAKPSVLENRVFLPHVAEGIDAFAHNEVLCLTGRGTNPASLGANLAAPNSTFIHAVAVTKDDVDIVKSAGMSVVWSPRSNISLYGDTLPVTLYDAEKINIAIATDWTPSGSINLLHELECAADFNSKYLKHHFSDEQLWKMVTINAAKALGFADQIGAIKPGLFADLIVVSSTPNNTLYSSIVTAKEKDIVLVMQAGRVLYGDYAIVSALRTDCEDMENVCGNRKAVCLAETGYTFKTLKAANKNSYSLFLCEPNALRPSCTPARFKLYNGQQTLDDSDGDGVPDLRDNCPSIFNPARPMDNGKQVNICPKP